jgi:hypothetical protein
MDGAAPPPAQPAPAGPAPPAPGAREGGREIPAWILAELNKRYAVDAGLARPQPAPAAPTPAVRGVYEAGPPWLKMELPAPREPAPREPAPAPVPPPPSLPAAATPLFAIDESRETNLTTTTTSTDDDRRDEVEAEAEVEVGDEENVELPLASFDDAAPQSPPRLALRIHAGPENILSPMSIASQQARSLNPQPAADIEQQLAKLEGRLGRIREEKRRRKGGEGYAEWKDKVTPKVQQILGMISLMKQEQGGEGEGWGGGA